MKKFQLTIIGSGTMMPTKNRHPSCYLLEINQKRMLLDFGHASIARIVDLGIDLHSIDTIFISHFHTDHFADVLPFVHSRWVDDIYCPEKKHKKLTIIGPKSIEKRWKKLREVFWIEPQHYPLKFIEGAQTIKIDGIQIELFEITHVQWYQSLGIKIIFQNKSFVYTGDIGGNHDLRNLKQIVQGVDLLLVEAGGIHPTPIHFTIDQIIELMDASKIKKVIATHLRDVNLPILKEKIKNHDNITLAKDLMQVKI